MKFLRIYSKLVCFMTLALIALGALVKSTESGLSVPDWPTTYGHFMFSFPLDQMVGGIKYEHTHRMLASIVGLMAVILCIWLLKSNAPAWIRRLGIWAVLMVILQGVLGGLTVKFMLPVWLSSMHGVLAQTFLVTLLIIAYGLSQERGIRLNTSEDTAETKFIKASVILAGMIYLQLIFGNVMRHSEAGLAIPDFPTMGGMVWPSFTKEWLSHINQWRFEHNLEAVTMGQVHIHLLHRIWALLIVLKLFYVNALCYKFCLNRPIVLKSLFLLNFIVVLQVMLGISTVLMMKEPITTSLHVTVGAITLALSVLLILRTAPLTIKGWSKVYQKQS